MRLKILFLILCIGILSTGVILYADVVRSDPTLILSAQEMAQTFGSCPDCTLGEDKLVGACYDGGKCPICVSWVQCAGAKYPEGNYVYACHNSGVEDGYCCQGELIDCYQHHYCDINGAHYEDKSCPGTRPCDDPQTIYGCCNCQKGDPVGQLYKQREWNCFCGGC